jgi:hypothetical protein
MVLHQTGLMTYLNRGAADGFLHGAIGKHLH